MSEYIRIADPELFNTIINIAHCPVGTCLASLGDGCFRGSDVHKMRYDVAKGILDRRRIAKEIETGVGNDDRRMEYLIDKANTCTSLTCPTGPDCTDRCMAFAALEPSPYGLFQLKAPQVEEKAVSKKQALERQLDRILTEIDKLEAIGEDIYEDDTVLSIKLRYPNGEKEYDYIAFKSAGRWYLTGYQNAGPRSWEKMMEFFSHGELVGIWRVTEWEQIV